MNLNSGNRLVNRSKEGPKINMPTTIYNLLVAHNVQTKYEMNDKLYYEINDKSH